MAPICCCGITPEIPAAERGEWMLESGINSEENAVLEVKLGRFNSWFWETFKYKNYSPSQENIADFIQQHIKE